MYSKNWTSDGVGLRNSCGRLSRDGQSHGIVLLAGWQATENNWSDATGSQVLVPLVEHSERGHVACSVGVESYWGNSTMRDRITTLVDACQAASYFPAGKVHLVGNSAGSLCALLWALANPTRVASLALALAPVDIQSLYDRNPLGVTASIDAAYGGRPPDSENPALRAAELLGIPICLWYSSSDPVGLEAETLAFAEDAGATLQGMGAVDHTWGDQSVFNGLAVASWIEANDPETSAPPSTETELWVHTIELSGVGHNLTDRHDDLQFSNVNPGGDERCGFTYKRPWGTVLPEIARGNVVQIGHGLDVLWQGRIAEHDPSGDESESIAVTAYGSGAALKDNTFAEIYRDADLQNWREDSRAQRISLLGIGFNVLGFATEPDVESGLPAIALDGSGRWPTGAVSDAVYDAGPDARLGRVDYQWTAENHGGGGLTATTWSGSVFGADDDTFAGLVSGTDVLTGATAGARSETAVDGKRIAVARFSYNGASAGDACRKWTLFLTVYGDHGLSERANGGFTVDQMVADIVGRVDGITARRIDPQSFEVLQAAFIEPTVHEDAIIQLNAYEGCDWGTWGPDSPLDRSTDGRFDFTNRDPTAAHWFVLREECAGLDLHTEISTLFDTVKLSYTDAAGMSRYLTRTAEVRELIDAGMSPKTLKLDGATLTEAAAEALADTFLALAGGFAPARGSVTIERPIRHHTRGLLPPCYLRADGSNLRIPDILPTSTLFDLDAAPDRRTTFPIRRVTVDAGGEKVSATVELDQSNDLLDVLQARLGLAAERLG